MTKDLPSHHVVTLAVYLLGGAKKFIDTEDVAKKVNELAPGRFTWRKYPDQINLELIRVFLSDAKKPDKGVLLDGSGRKGWTLTPEGLRLAQSFSSADRQTDRSRTTPRARAGSVDSMRMDREIRRLQGTAAWAKWPQGASEISEQEARDVFRIDSYATGDLLPLKLNRLRNLMASDEAISSFLTHLAQILTKNGNPDNE